jgi:hypothetical protein
MARSWVPEFPASRSVRAGDGRPLDPRAVRSLAARRGAVERVTSRGGEAIPADYAGALLVALDPTAVAQAAFPATELWSVQPALHRPNRAVYGFSASRTFPSYIHTPGEPSVACLGHLDTLGTVPAPFEDEFSPDLAEHLSDPSIDVRYKKARLGLPPCVSVTS